MSNAATRTRRTVPLDELDDGRTGNGLSETYSRRSSSLSEKAKRDHPAGAPRRTSSLKSETQQQSSATSRFPSYSGVGGSSAHSRSSYKSRASSVETSQSLGFRPHKSQSVASTTASSSSTSSDGNRIESNQRGPSRTRSMGGNHGSRTPSSGSNKAERLTIGHSSGMGSSRSFFPPLNQHESTASSSIPLSSAMPDLFLLEQAISEYGEGDGVERLIRNERQRRPHDRAPTTPQRQSSDQTKTPVAWKTPFEIDAPRETPLSKSFTRRSNSPTFSTMSEPLMDPRLSEEQDAWAGIDALLETRSLDDSFTFSTSDILPSSTVKAMRKEGSFRSIDTNLNNDDDMSEVSDGLAVLTLKNQRKAFKKNSRYESGMPSLVEASDQDEESDSKVGTEYHGPHHGSGALNGGGGGGTLFDVFHWSEKDNVDETKGRQKKLNQTRKVKISPAHSIHGLSNTDSDTASLPSLNSFRDDELSTRSESSDWHSMHDKGSVVTEDVYTIQKEEYRRRVQQTTIVPAVAIPELGSQPAFVIDTFKRASPSPSTSSLTSDGLVLDKHVDEYIRRLQARLPTISEDVEGKVGRTKSIVEFLVEENSPSPTSVVTDELPFEALPSLASFAPASSTTNRSVAQRSGRGNGRKEEKREPKPSLSAQLISSIKRMRTKTGAISSGAVGAIGGTNKATNRAPVVKGDEEKYFPDTAKQDKSRLFSANRCLLNSGVDGVNWDVD